MPHQKGKKNRKFGRAARSPSHKRYNAEQRWITNKINRIKTHLNRSKKQAERIGCGYDLNAERWLEENA